MAVKGKIIESLLSGWLSMISIADDCCASTNAYGAQVYKFYRKEADLRETRKAYTSHAS